MLGTVEPLIDHMVGCCQAVPLERGMGSIELTLIFLVSFIFILQSKETNLRRISTLQDYSCFSGRRAEDCEKGIENPKGKGKVSQQELNV